LRPSLTSVAGALFVICLSTPPASFDWPGWRGPGAQGRSPLPLPTQWSTTENIRWRAAIPGRGHSSPVVAGNHVYVSTAYPSAAFDLKAAVSIALTVAAAVLAALGIRLTVLFFHPAGRPRFRHVAGSAALLAILISELVLIVAGESLLDFARCPIRAWIASACVGTLTVVLGLFPLASRSMRILTGAASVIVAAVTMIGVPAKAHAFRGGVLAVNTEVMMATAGMPLLLGLVAAWTLLPPSRGRRAVAAGGGLVVALAVVYFTWQLLSYREDTLPPLESLDPRLGGYAWLPMVVLAAVATMAWRCRRDSLLAHAAVVLAGCGALLSAVAIAIDQLATHSPYVAYHLGTLKLALTLPAPLVGVGAALVVFDAAVFLHRHRTIQPLHSRRLVAGFQICGTAVAVLFFARSSVLQTDDRMLRAMVSVDRITGRILWTAEGLEAPEDAVDRRNSPATPTPVTDGERVCAYFGNSGLMCADTGGRILWTRTDLHYDGFYGAGSSPVLSNGVLVLASGISGHATVRALDVRTGSTLWTAEFDDAPPLSGNNRTPLIERVGGRQAVLFWGTQHLIALDLQTGSLLWRHAVAGGGDLVASLVSDDERVYLSDAAGTRAFALGALDGSAEPQHWFSQARSNCVSPVLCNGLLLTVTDRGILSALERGTGALAWRCRLKGEYLASPIATDRVAYFMNTAGLTTVVSCDSTPRVIAENDLGEPIVASAAAADGLLYVRTSTSLYCIHDMEGAR
jgi:outer membrane protein assembly factor BamB